MKVHEIMTPNVISVAEDAPVREVAQLLNRHRISGLPVCDMNGHMVGLITEYDLIAKSDARSAADAMSRDVIAVMEYFFFSSRRRHTRFDCDWSSDVCSSD